MIKIVAGGVMTFLLISLSLRSHKKSNNKEQGRPIRICVFCGSKSGKNPEYVSQARLLGESLVKRKIELVYGGGTIGLMGVIAEAVNNKGGVVHSVIPKPLIPYSGDLLQSNNCIITTGMHERKRKFVELSDAFIALPGGLGTMEELAETATWRQIGVHNKPFGVLNICNFWDPFLDMLRLATREGFLDEKWKDGGLMFSSDIEHLLDEIVSSLEGRRNDSLAISTIKQHEWVI